MVLKKKDELNLKYLPNLPEPATIFYEVHEIKGKG